MPGLLMKLFGIIFGLNKFRWSSGKSVCLWSCTLGFDSESGPPVTVKLVFTASLFDVQQ